MTFKKNKNNHSIAIRYLKRSNIFKSWLLCADINFAEDTTLTFSVTCRLDSQNVFCALSNLLSSMCFRGMCWCVKRGRRASHKANQGRIESVERFERDVGWTEEVKTLRQWKEEEGGEGEGWRTSHHHMGKKDEGAGAGEGGKGNICDWRIWRRLEKKKVVMEWKMEGNGERKQGKLRVRA